MDRGGRLARPLTQDRWPLPAVFARARAAQQSATGASSQPTLDIAPVDLVPRPAKAPSRAIAPIVSALRIGLLAAALFAVTTYFDLWPESRATQNGMIAAVDAKLGVWGLGIEQVTLSGQRYTSDNDIFAALDLANARSLLRFRGQEAAERILRLPWIERVQIRPIVPNALEIVITERTPYAVWDENGRRLLVDKTGHVLASVGAQAFAELPRIRGAGAPAAAADLHATLSIFPAIADRLTVAERVGDRRWTLELSGATRVDLPAEHETSALQTLAVLQSRHAILDHELADIDLRTTPPVVRLREQPVAPAATEAESGRFARSRL